MISPSPPTPPTRLKCVQGHGWEAGASSAAPLVCPVCGRPPVMTPGGVGGDPDQTIDQADRTIDLPTPSPPSSAAGSPPGGRAMDRNEVTSAMHFTPLPRPSAGSAGTGKTGERPSGTPSGAPAPQGMAPGAYSGAMPFTILRQHARGGLGLVNLARDQHINREVALKQILPQHADNGTLKKRFLYEAQITGQLEHPSIVPVYSLGNDETGNPYYIMRFVKGRTLDAIITEHHSEGGGGNPIVFRELLRRFIAVCQAVAYAHSRGVIHRDLKPSNIMLGDYGETLVLDWGLAKDIKNKADPFEEGGGSRVGPAGKAAEPSSAGTHSRPAEASTGGAAGRPNPHASQANMPELTMQGQIIGTPAYMAPEQAEGRTDLHGPVTDIYALGGILYKILTGQSPAAPDISTSGPQGLRRLTFVESPVPSKINKNVPPLLEQICLRAMAREPAGRYPRALELAQDIQRWLDEHPLSLKRETALGKALAVGRKYAWLIGLGLLVVIAVLLAIQLFKGQGRSR